MDWIFVINDRVNRFGRSKITTYTEKLICTTCIIGIQWILSYNKHIKIANVILGINFIINAWITEKMSAIHEGFTVVLDKYFLKVMQLHYSLYYRK